MSELSVKGFGVVGGALLEGVAPPLCVGRLAGAVVTRGSSVVVVQGLVVAAAVP